MAIGMWPVYVSVIRQHISVNTSVSELHLSFIIHSLHILLLMKTSNGNSFLVLGFLVSWFLASRTSEQELNLTIAKQLNLMSSVVHILV